MIAFRGVSKGFAEYPTTFDQKMTILEIDVVILERYAQDASSELQQTHPMADSASAQAKSSQKFSSTYCNASTNSPTATSPLTTNTSSSVITQSGMSASG